MVMPTMTYTHERIGKASWVRMTSPSVEVKNISKNTKMRLYTSIVIASAMYASETWRTTDKTNRMFNVFNRRWHNGSVMEGPRDKWRTSIKCLQDIVADRRRRFIGHVLRLPTSRPASLVIDWTPEGGSRRWGRPKRTWQDTCREDLQEVGVSGSDTHEARSIASDRAQWRQLVAQCSSSDRRTYV